MYEVVLMSCVTFILNCHMLIYIMDSLALIAIFLCQHDQVIFCILMDELAVLASIAKFNVWAN